VYDDYNMSRISQSDFVDILDTLENFLLRRYVCRTIRAELNKLFPFLYNNAKNYSSLAQGVRDVLGSRSYPSDELFVEELTTSPLYGPGDRRERLRLILERLEESYGHRETVVSTALSIEHIMPQKLTPWWENHLGEDVAEVHETLLHTLGNLTLTGNNAELSNLEFPQKKIILRDSHLELNKGVADAPCWTRAQIERRAQELGARALLVWPNLGPARQASSRATGNVTGKTPSTVVIYERRFPVDTWQGVLQNTLTEMAELGADILEAMAETFPRSISRNDAGMRSPKQITQEWYYESHLNADQIHRFCKQVTQLAGLSADEWYVEVK